MTASRDPVPRSIDEVREEFLTNGMDGWLWRCLHLVLQRFVRARVARHYRAAVYSPSGEWDDEGLGDLVNDFIVDHGIGKGVIARALTRAPSLPAFVVYLERSLHHFAIGQRGQSVGRNIYHRLQDALARNPELRPLAGVGRKAAYGDFRWEEDVPPIAGGELLRGAERHLPEDLPIVEYRTGHRRSPLLARAELDRIAVALIRSTGHLMTARQILEIIGRRFDLQEGLAVAGADDAFSALVGSEVDPLQGMVAEETADLFLDRLSDRQLEVLKHWGADPPLSSREIGEATGLGKSTVNNEQRAIRKILRCLGVGSHEEHAQVLAIVLHKMDSRSVAT